ncbi:unnamed protein product [Urochloa decumbens]|uniref:F-box domain-containing protein n=1 Tax=Urochloa decumbens TaxID=240449 RepID=A0ABC9F6H9_9POAL
MSSRRAGARKAKRRRAPTPSAAALCAAGAGVDDVISSLGDDVLVRILELLPDTRDAVRTGALSRRWRGLWTRLPALRFASGSRPEFSSAANGSQRYIAFVNDALALRVAQTEPAVEHLAITFIMRSLLQRCFEAAQGWIEDAVRNDVKSFVLELHRSIDYNYNNHGSNNRQKLVITLEHLASSSKMETMRLALGGATLRLPAAATFASLVDLSLENLEFADGSGHLLNRLLSPACCPRLRKLSLRKIGFTGLDELLLEAETLLELSMKTLLLCPMVGLILRSPSLRVLHMQLCNLNVLTLSVPMLEEFWFLDAHPFSNINTDQELSCIKSLKVELTSHACCVSGDEDEHMYGYEYMYNDDDDDEDTHSDDDANDMNSASIGLLKCCATATCLDVNLYITQVSISSSTFKLRFETS